MITFSNDLMQRQRFELKYVVSEHVALGVRDFVSSYLELDAHGATRPNLSYPVHSLYLDSPDLALYRATINGEKNRFKLRVRFYENAEDRPVYLEIKRRINNIIRKKRVAVSRAQVHEVVEGHMPSPGELLTPAAESVDALEAFCRYAAKLRARPQTHVRYLREAWVADGSNKIRVTLDREVMGERRCTIDFSTELERPVRVFGDRVILELKFTDRFPEWMRELVRAFDLRQSSVAKYVDGIWRMGERGMISAYA